VVLAACFVAAQFLVYQNRAVLMAPHITRIFELLISMTTETIIPSKNAVGAMRMPAEEPKSYGGFNLPQFKGDPKEGGFLPTLTIRGFSRILRGF
jgi:hypothetical protein